MPRAKWRQDVAPTVLRMATEMDPEGLTARAVAQRLGLLEAQIWRGRADILFLVAADLQLRQAKAVSRNERLRKRGARARVEAHLARMLAFAFEPDVKASPPAPVWRRAGTGRTSSLRRCRGDPEGPLEPIVKDLGTAVAAVLAVYEATFQGRVHALHCLHRS
jgi:hypothetical protein